jgi:hypothetical protein
MTVYQLAIEFSNRLRGTLTAEQMAQMIERNSAEQSEGVCHSHDFCDANVIMLEAWRAIDAAAELHDITHNQRNAAKWGIAWDIAKTNDFDPALIEEQRREDSAYFEQSQAE